MLPSEESKSPLILEFEEFQHKLRAAIRVTYFEFRKQSKQILDIAFFQYTYKGQTSARPANTDEIMWVKDAEDPQRWKPINGRKLAQQGSPKSREQAAALAEARVENQRLMISLGLYYYLDVLLARMIPRVRENFREVAALARRYSSSDLLLQEAHLAPLEITACVAANQDSLSSLCEFWGHPEYAAAFRERFRVMFVEEFERLRSGAELAAPPQPSTQASESAGAVDEDESAAERWRKTEQIGDRLASRLPPRSGALADDAIMRPPELESESELVIPSVPAASPLEPAATPGPPAELPTPKNPEAQIPAQEIVQQAVAQEQQSGADAAAEQLSTRLKRGKLCEEMADEIKTIRGEAITNGKAMFEIREAYPEFLVWNAAERLLPEDRAVFEMPTRWGAANGYANRFLSKVFPPKSPATVNDWRKEFRAHKKQNPA